MDPTGRQYGTASIDAITSGFLWGAGGKKLYASHFRSFSATAAHFQPLPPIFAIWCPDRLAVSGDLKIGTAFNTAFRLEIRHEAWQEPSVIKTRLPWPAGEVRALWLSSKARRCNQQNALESAALRRRGVRQRCGRNQVCNEVCHFAGRAGPLASRLPRRGGCSVGHFGRETSHFESFQSCTLQNVSHFESF